VNLPWLELVSDEATLLRPGHEIRAAISEAGVGPDRPVVAYCRTGIRASLAF
jgi:3-mercaptopyruvate sulfurtransferase SseA